MPVAVPTPSPTPSAQTQTVDTSNWQTYRNDEFGFEVKYPEGEIMEFASLGESQNRFSAITELNFQGCFIAFLGAPFGIEDPSIEVKVTQDQTFIDGSQKDRTYLHFPTGVGFGVINVVGYPGPYEFLVYHSSEVECVVAINQILSTFRFVDDEE